MKQPFARRLLLSILLSVIALALAKPPELTMPDIGAINTEFQTVSCDSLAAANTVVWALLLFAMIGGLLTAGFTRNKGAGATTFVVALIVAVIYSAFVGTPNLTAPLGNCTPFG